MLSVDYPSSDLDPEDAEYEEESAADENDVPDGFEGDEEGLDHQLEAGSAVDHSEWLQDFEESQQSQHSEYLVLSANNGRGYK